MKTQIGHLFLLACLLSSCKGGGYVATVTARAIYQKTRQVEVSSSQTEMAATVDYLAKIEADSVNLCLTAQDLTLVPGEAAGPLWMITHIEDTKGEMERRYLDWTQEGLDLAPSLANAKTLFCLTIKEKEIQKCTYQILQGGGNETLLQTQVFTYIALIDIPTHNKVKELSDIGQLPPSECPHISRIPVPTEESGGFAGKHLTNDDIQKWVFDNWTR